MAHRRGKQVFTHDACEQRTLIFSANLARELPRYIKVNRERFQVIHVVFTDIPRDRVKSWTLNDCPMSG